MPAADADADAGAVSSASRADEPEEVSEAHEPSEHGLDPADLEAAQGLQSARTSLEQAAASPDSPGTAGQPMSLQAAPRQASELAYFAAQNLRHLVPVAVMRMLVQGAIAPRLAGLIESNPRGALAAQVVLTAAFLARRMASQVHTELRAVVANPAFAGDTGVRANAPRRLWQAVQTTGIAAGDAGALALTSMAVSTRPQLKAAAQALMSIQVRAHLLSSAREFLRPAINTVHVGNDAAQAAMPPDGRNLRPGDVTRTMSLIYGVAAGGLEFGLQMAMRAYLGERQPWEASPGPALAVGLMAGAANMLVSSVEDYLIDHRVAWRMQQTDASHVAHLRWESENPFSRHELGRQFERVDARVFNQMVPAMLAMAVYSGLEQAFPAGLGVMQRAAVLATVFGVVTGVMLGALLPKTVQSYQMNDAARRHRPSSQENPT